jgi:hypothetical protein
VSANLKGIFKNYTRSFAQSPCLVAFALLPVVVIFTPGRFAQPDNDSSVASASSVHPAWNVEGQLMSRDSSVGYLFSQHFGLDAGIQIYFVRGILIPSTPGVTEGGITVRLSTQL